MSQEDKNETGKKLNWIFPIYALLITASFICFELNFLRILTGIRMAFGLTSSFFFSAAILGLGFGSMMVVLKKERIRLSLVLPLISLTMISSYVIIYLLLKWRILLFTIGSWAHFFSYSFLFMPLITIPFILSGLAIARIFAQASGKKSTLLSTWAFDLIGSAIGGLLPIIFLDSLNPLAISIIPIIFSTGLVFLHWIRQRQRTVLVIAVMVFVVILSGYYMFVWDDINEGFISQIALSFADETPKMQTAELAGWSPYHRINYKTTGDTTHIFYNSAPITYILKEGNTHLFDQRVAWPFRYAPKGSSVLIIGAGGGKEVYFAKEITHASRIKAVELDPEVVNLVTGMKDYAPYIHGNDIDYIQGEGRHYLKTANKKFDMIVYALIDSPTTIAAQSIFKPENYIYTVESFNDATQLLNPGGIIVVYALANYSENPQQFSTMALKLHRNMVLATGEPEHTAVFDFNPVSKRQGTGTIHILFDKNGIDRKRLQSLVDPESIISDQASFQQQSMQVKPNYDRNPFIYIKHGLPKILGLFLGEILVFAALLMGIPLFMAFHRFKDDFGPGKRIPFVYFFCTGFGFFLLEVVLIHKLVVSFGAPHISSSVIITTLLIGMGVTSLVMAFKWGGFVINRPSIAFTIIVVVLAVLPAYVHLIDDVLLPFGLLSRTIITIGMLLPVGLVLGVPFPLGLNRMRFKSKESVILAYALDAMGSVMGIVGAIIIPMLFGYPVVFAIIALNYIIAAVLFLSKFPEKLVIE